MNGVRPAASSLRQAISLVLMLALGPAPLISLLARSNEPQCQMACCKRKGGGASCALHHSAVPDSSSLGFHAAINCPPGCSQTAAAPSAFSAGIVAPRVKLTFPPSEDTILTARAPGARWMADPSLHQRPPPSSLA